MRAHDGGEGEVAARDDGLAPVIPIGTAWHRTWTTEPSPSEVSSPAALDAEITRDLGEVDDIEAAQQQLLRKLRARSLSVREARAVLAETGLATAAIDVVIDDLSRLGYLDDAALAEQITYAGSVRKGHGRQVIAQTLSRRGVPRDVADVALEALPDDDLERAMEFAATKARSLSGLAHETALRRLVGQLTRRGYAGSVAMTAARHALSSGESGSSGVRFR